MNFEFDAYDHKIIALLQDNARLSYAELGRHIHLTSPAVTERVRRLEEAGVITGYRAKVNLRKLGYSFEAFVQVIVESHEALDEWANTHVEVLANHATTGNHCALLRLAIKTPEHLQELLKSLGELGKTSTSIVLTSQCEERARLHVDEVYIDTE
ncbi:MAG: Lrp/AsnC family transcriptional regulator [Undibacterium sp.]|nr:Lrp/AsnC family transcriptional regulator [Undibacterium sp.]